ncbi:hypothetical protein CMO88_00875 [Candidatus Woesearchaeota archaeon]|nr:hypothetical protein [Candidatus Woesearchaeota archaeon]|tara:strand:- start:18935 stop:20743 length:1809 start_codon:yes stop_codon:yes gene_type:complete
MALMKRLGLAIFTGMLVGLVAGTLEVAYKIFTLVFEWYEIYQIYLFAFILFVFIFLIIGLFLELLFRLVKIPVSRNKLAFFYFVTSLYLLPFIYLSISLNLLWIRSALLAPKSILINLSVVVIFGILYFLTLIKGKAIARLLNFLGSKKINVIAKNLLFFIIFFISVSLVTDVYSFQQWSKTAQPSDENSPNVLLITLDTVRADHLSLYGYDKNTSPVLAEFAKDAVVFENAVSAGSWSMPSHASMFTGNYPSNHNAVKTHQKLDSSQLTLAEILKERKYNTGAIITGAFLTGKFGFSQGFITYRDRLDFLTAPASSFSLLELLKFLPVDSAYFDGLITDEQMNQDFLSWLDKNQAPFFFFMQYFNVHEFRSTPEILKQFTGETISFSEVQAAFATSRYEPVDKEVVEYMEALYDAAIFFQDQQLQSLFQNLEQRGILDNTIVIITADHGDEFYEHGLFSHGQTLYEEVIHVPLIIRYPKELKPQRISTPVETMNVFSTVLDLLNAEQQDVDSISFLPLIQNGSYNREYVLSELHGREYFGETNQKSLRQGNWKLIEVYTEKETLPPSLFNLDKDPEEQENLYDSNEEKRKEMQALLNDVIS